MKWNMFLGALVVSFGLCSQSFGFELLNRMLLGHNSCCQSSCCEPTCCEAPACCEPTCCEAPACCEPTCCEAPACCEPACCESACCCKRRIDLFGGLRNLFHRNCCRSSCCESACCEPTCCEAPACCEPACCEAPSCCDSGCCKSHCGRRRCGLFANLFKTRKSCCNVSCCDTGCTSGCSACNGGHSAPAPAEAGADDEIGPPPMADPAASLHGKRRIVTASRSVVRN